MSTVMLGPRHRGRRRGGRSGVTPAARREVEVDLIRVGEQPALEVAEPLADEHADGAAVARSRVDRPASSRASHAASSNSRCCGSMLSASRGEMPKNAASNRSSPSRKPPQRVIIRPGVFGVGSKNRSSSMPSRSISPDGVDAVREQVPEGVRRGALRRETGRPCPRWRWAPSRRLPPGERGASPAGEMSATSASRWSTR